MELMDETSCLCYSPPPSFPHHPSLFHTWSSLSQILFFSEVLSGAFELDRWIESQSRLCWKENISCCSSESHHGPMYRQQICFHFQQESGFNHFYPSAGIINLRKRGWRKKESERESNVPSSFSWAASHLHKAACWPSLVSWQLFHISYLSYCLLLTFEKHINQHFLTWPYCMCYKPLHSKGDALLTKEFFKQKGMNS